MVQRDAGAREAVSVRSAWMPVLDDASPVPLYEQVIEQVALAVTAGELGPGDPLPSVRELAARVRINPNTAARALREMDRLGLARTNRGVGTVVDEGAGAVAPEIAGRILTRSLDRAVGIGRQLGLDRDELSRRLQNRWSMNEEVAE